MVERDDAPPDIEPTAAFEGWHRPGVPQFRASHSLLARLHTQLRSRHPALLAELAAAGVAPCAIDLVLPSNQIAGHTPRTDDGELQHLLGRRATFEYVLRRHVGALPNVRFVHGARVDGLAIAREGEQLRVRGLSYVRGDQHEALEADIVVDASGGRSSTAAWLRAQGAAIDEEAQPSDFAYFCRHYRLRDGGKEPFRKRTGAILDYLWFGAFFAEHGHFSLALACPNEEPELVQTMRHAEGFDAIGRSMPGVEELLARAEPTSKVIGAGGLTNRWTRHVDRRGPAALGFFAVGDAHVQTNPMYGRGCSAAFVQAAALAATLRDEADPVARGKRFAAAVHEELRPQYEFCVNAEQLFQGRGLRARGLPAPRSLQAADYFTDQIWAPSVLESRFIARESVKTMQMQAVAPFWTRIGLLLCMVLLWLRRGFRKAPLVPERTGPAREELLAKLRGRGERSAAE